MEAQCSSSQAVEAAKLKIAGAWSGVLDVDLRQWTLPMLRQEIANRASCSPECINLIFAGKILRDVDGKNDALAQMGVRNNAKILANRVSIDQGKAILDEAQRTQRLARIRAAAVAMAKRHASGTLPIEDFNIELEDQSGQKVYLRSENDRRSMMMGLMLHSNAKQLIKSRKYKDALDVLNMGEEAFSVCDPKVLEMIDNVPLLEIDTVWCYFMLRDISWLSMAGVRLAKAREGLEQLQKGRYPELAVFMRLELLEGIVAYHSGRLEQSRKVLQSAQEKYLQLQVSDEALSLLMSMGYGEQSAKRALRMTNQNVDSAIDFLVEEKERQAQRLREEIKERAEILEQKKYGSTPLNKAVNLERLNELVSIGYERCLAAEALRRNENDTQKALDDLTNPETNSLIQLCVESRKRKRIKPMQDAAVDELVSMGFERSRVIAALRASDTKEEALNRLVSNPAPNVPTAAPSDHAGATGSNHVEVSSDGLFVDEDRESSPSRTKDTEDERDAEMEAEITRKLSGNPLSDYDIETTIEGEAIAEYLALLASKA